jgi:hypothetical protein
MQNDGYKPVHEVAAEIGVSERAIYLRIKGEKYPALAAREIAGRSCIRAEDAFEHFERYGRRPPGLRRPADLAPAHADVGIAKKPEFDADILRALGDRDPFSIEPHELSTLLFLNGVPESKIKVAVQLANSLQRKRDSEARAGRNLAPEDVIRMLRAHGEIVAEQVDAAAPRFVVSLLSYLRKSFSIDLVAKNSDAQRQLEALVLNEIGAGTIKAVKTEIENQVRGVQVLEFER